MILKDEWKKAFTLAEVLVAAAILSLLTTIGVFLVQFGQLNARTLDHNAENHRQGTQAVARVRREVRGAHLVTPEVGEQAQKLLYQYPRVVEGQLEVDANGHPLFDGEALIYQDGDILKLEKPVGGPVQLLARLQGGSFRVEADDRFFTFFVVVGGENDPRFRFESKFRVARR